MRFIDLHCDTASRLFYEKKHLDFNDCSIDIQKLKKGDCLAQFFAFFIDCKNCSPNNEFQNMYKNFMNELDLCKNDISIAGSLSEIIKNDDNKKMSAVLTIEDGGVLEGSMENLYDVYDKGIRLITLTWNYENEIGYPNYKKEFMNKGLKEFGIDAVLEMNKKGIIIDTSHLSDGGFYDVAKYSSKPFVASHSNSRSITNHSRNLTDDMIRVLADKGGIMGLNYCNAFMGDSKVTTIEEMICHLKHIINVGGYDVVSLGSDFDGIENEVEFKNPSEIYKLYDALLKSGFTEDIIEKIFYKNAIRFLKDTL